MMFGPFAIVACAATAAAAAATGTADSSGPSSASSGSSSSSSSSYSSSSPPNNALWSTVCAPGDVSSTYPFCDYGSLSIDDRAADLVSRLTLGEKQGLLGNGAAAVPRLGIPPYQWWSEGLHGPLEPCVAAAAATSSGDDGGTTEDKTKKCPTSFPAASAMAAAFNDTLYRAAGSVTGVEGRSVSNLRTHDGSVGDGLTYWAPNANMERDPRWGRNMEAPGEDPHLSARYVASYVRGMQEGSDPDHVQVAATCKHFVANELEHTTMADGTVITRHDFDAQIPLPELVDYYLPSFEACVKEGRALGIMCSYNRINGVPACAAEVLLTDVLRDRWNFDGYVTSDCGAIDDIWKNHHFVPDGAAAAAAGLRAGCDSDCGPVYGSSTVDAVEAGILSEETVDRSLIRLVKVQMRLGLFDPKDDQTYFDPTLYGMDQIDAAEHRKLALDAALQSIVLLKNDGGVLPLQRGGKIALIGPHVNAREVFLSNYHGERCPDKSFDCIVSPLEAITEANAQGVVTSAEGCGISGGPDRIAEAAAVAGAADAVVLLVGIDGSQEGEEHDRANCTLPGIQPKLVEAIAATKKPTVMVLIHGGAMCLGPLKGAAPAIVDAFYGGEQGGTAIAAVLFGDYNPSGKLPVTMYPPEYMADNPITQMSVRAPPGRTHLYYTGTPEFAFGTGLSYSSWTVEVLSEPDRRDHVLPTDRVDGTAEASSAVAARYSVRLTNAGPRAGRQRVLAYVRPRGQAAAVPGVARQRLWAYRAAEELGVGEGAVFAFELTASALAVSNGDGDRVLHPGEYEVAFSDGSGSEVKARSLLRVAGSPKIVEASIFNNGLGMGGTKPIPVEETRAWKE